MLVSVPFLLLTIFCYCCILKIKNDYEKCLIPYLTFLAMTYLLTGVAVVMNKQIPPLMASVGLFFVKSYLIWHCILCFEIWSRCTTMLERSSYFLWYFIVGSIGPLLMIGIDYAVENICKTRCSLRTNLWLAPIFFYGLFLIVIIFSATLFCKTLRYINNSAADLKHRRDERQMFFVSVRLLQLMCVSWMLEIISNLLGRLISQDIPLFIIPDTLNATQGIIIFYSYVCRRRVSHAVKRLYERRRSPPH
ncbi:probable G-protein coupled receptor Mth-like 2 [Musca autumnalis]|uniref:probable G-protein coupled receptor Mth-like 2 n=1 Tax=Musca autumnalis TaxID=221902 RepID=UPI003CF4CC9D